MKVHEVVGIGAEQDLVQFASPPIPVQKTMEGKGKTFVGSTPTWQAAAPWCTSACRVAKPRRTRSRESGVYWLAVLQEPLDQRVRTWVEPHASVCDRLNQQAPPIMVETIPQEVKQGETNHLRQLRRHCTSSLPPSHRRSAPDTAAATPKSPSWHLQSAA